MTDSKLTQRHSLLGTESFTYFEALLFKYFGCCVRKEGKIKQYKRQIKMLRERMDVKNVILFEGYSLAIINATMEPYQIKLLKYLSQNDLEEYQDLTSIPIDDATSKLIEKLTLEENDLKPREKKANQYLITAVSQD